MLDLAKTFHASDRAATVIGFQFYQFVFNNIAEMKMTFQCTASLITRVQHVQAKPGTSAGVLQQ
jgi:hypothetical protein